LIEIDRDSDGNADDTLTRQRSTPTMSCTRIFDLRLWRVHGLHP